MIERKRSNRGGRREGAGRKPLPADQRKTNMSVRVPLAIARWYDAQPGTRSEVMLKALKYYCDIDA